MPTSSKQMEQEAFDRISFENAKRLVALLLRDASGEVYEVESDDEVFRDTMNDDHGNPTLEQIYEKFPQLNPSSEGKIQIRTKFIQETIGLYKNFCTETYGNEHKLPEAVKQDNGSLLLSFNSDKDALAFAKSQSDKKFDFVMTTEEGVFVAGSINGEFFTDEKAFNEKTTELNYQKTSDTPLTL